MSSENEQQPGSAGTFEREAMDKPQEWRQLRWVEPERPLPQKPR